MRPRQDRFWQLRQAQRKCEQREINDSIRVTERWRGLVKNEGSVRNVVNRNYYSNFAGARVGIVCHDGSYWFWEWDSKKVCFVPLVLK
jgi:hypothetical protein